MKLKGLSRNLASLVLLSGTSCISSLSNNNAYEPIARDERVLVHGYLGPKELGDYLGLISGVISGNVELRVLEGGFYNFVGSPDRDNPQREIELLGQIDLNSDRVIQPTETELLLKFAPWLLSQKNK